MSSQRNLTVCLCIEDLDSCMSDILINQVATGQLFGFDQNFHLMLQSSDAVYKLKDLSMDVQDCAFPVVTGISCHKSFRDIASIPDVILILLSSRSFPYKTDTATQEEFQKLLSLVLYITQLSDMLSVLQLETTEIIITGDLALTAASLMSHKLSKLTAKQLMAIDFQQPQRVESTVSLIRGYYSKTKKICDTLKQWWSGVKTSALLYLGVKYTDPTRRMSMKQGTGYFFSAPVSLEGPGKFISSYDLHIDHDHVEQVKDTTDKAFNIVQEVNGQCNHNKDNYILVLSHL